MDEDIETMVVVSFLLAIQTLSLIYLTHFFGLFLISIFFSCDALNLQLTPVKYLKSFFSFKQTISGRNDVAKKHKFPVHTP